MMSSIEADVGGTSLSRQIKTVGISETYDLAGYGESQARKKGNGS